MENQRKLNGALGLSYVIIFVIANIIGSGVYKKAAPMAVELQSPSWVLLAWIAAGIITFMGALSNAEVAGLLANTGGTFTYLRKIYNRFFSFIYGWSLFSIIQTATIASLAYVFAQSLSNMIAIPDIFASWESFSVGGIFFPFQDSGIKITAIILILALTFINMMGLKGGAWMSKSILLFVSAGLLLIIYIGIFRGSHHSDLLDFSYKKGITVSSFYTAMLAAFWAYQGWDSVGFIGGEIKNARITVPKGITIGVIIIIALYFLVNYACMALLSIPDLIDIHNAGNQIAAVEAVRKIWPGNGVMFISVLILVSTLGCAHASVLTGARPYYAMAHEQLFFSQVAKINRYNVPGNSLLWQGIWSSILVLSGTFDQLTDMVIFAVFIFYGATTLGVFILRKKMPNANRPYKVWGYPFIPAIYILFCIGLFFNTIITRPREAAIGLALILAGIPVFLFLEHKSKKGPKQLRD